jgi:hypothetical protein
MDIIFNLLGILSQGITGIVIAGLAMILMPLALIRKDAGLMVIVAVLMIPIAYVMGAWTGLELIVRLLPFFALSSALAISRDEFVFAWILPLPPFVYLGYYIFNLLVLNFRGF